MAMAHGLKVQGKRGSLHIAVAIAVLSIAPAACSGESGGPMGGRSDSGTAGTGSGTSGSEDAGSSGSGGSSGAGGDPTRPPAVCEPSVSLYDTSAGRVVGDGTPESCTEQALRALAEQGGTIRFDCGPAPVTIELTETIQARIDTDTIIDGEGRVTLDAGKLTRHFNFNSANWMVTRTKLVLQRLTLINGKAPASAYVPPIRGFPLCSYGHAEGMGGAVFVRDGVLEVIDCDFIDNEAALIGPDVGGGAIHVQGSASVVISGSTFMGNTASNGGAVAVLFGNPEIYNSHFEDNTAVGIGRNSVTTEAECPARLAFAPGHQNQGGAGGSAGAVYFDGPNDESHTFVICGSTFRNNRSNELGGALFRTPNVGMRNMRITDSTFDSNTAALGGVSFIMQNDLTVERTTFMNNRAGVRADGTATDGFAGGLWVAQGTADITNSTFHDSDLNLDAAGTLRNVTVSAASLPDGVTVHNSLFVDCDCSSPRAGDHNVQWPTGGACAGGAVFADPGLRPPADNGGATPTMLPANASAVAGVGAMCPTEDQRGMRRSASSCAAGAVEP